MNLLLKRLYLKPTYTIGALRIDGAFFSDSLEDKYRDLSKEAKVPGQTAIPCGTYRVVMDYSPKFKMFMPHILDVPQFDGVRIHGGVTAAHTEGCPLVGRNTAPGMLTEGLKYSEKLREILTACKEPVFIEITL